MKPDVDQYPTGSADVTASLMLRADPVADLAGDTERAWEETDASEELGTAPEASPAEPDLVGHDGLEPRPLILDRADALHERHPLTEARPFFVDRLPQRVQITQLVAAQHDPFAQLHRQRAHRAGARHSSSRIP